MKSSRKYLPAKTEQTSDSDWRQFENGDAHLQRFAYLLETGLWTDVTFIVGKVKQEFNAHKLILRTGSKVFDELFKENMSLNSFKIRDVEPEEFILLLKFLYTGKYNENGRRMPGLRIAALKYQISDLVEAYDKQCGAQVVQNNELNLSMYKLAVKHNAHGLKKTSLERICRFGTRLVKSKEFVKLSSAELSGILERDDLNIRSERELFEAVLKWAETECKRQNSEITAMNLRSALTEVLCHIRFTQMDPTYFVFEVVSTNILFSDEIMPILQHFSVQEIHRSFLPVGTFNPKARMNYSPCGETFVLRRLVRNSAATILDLREKTPLSYLYISTANEEHIRIKSSMPIWVTSAGINCTDGRYPHKCMDEVSAQIQIKDDNGDTVAEKDETVSGIQRRTTEVYHIKFNRPVYLQQQKWYTITFKLFSGYFYADYYKALDGIGATMDYKFNDGNGNQEVVKFEFQNQGNPQYTGMNQGFIPEIGFMVE